MKGWKRQQNKSKLKSIYMKIDMFKLNGNLSEYVQSFTGVVNHFILICLLSRKT